jgi:CRP-like cAMP-binding protein/Fe-S-cluster-containing hydrogenase component 2
MTNRPTTGARQTLAQKAEAEVMACIGCNDCMLACPLPNAKTTTIAELNAAVHLPLIGAGNVMDFVLACTQCRQCVPACPADLSRADMVLFNKMKVEDQVPDYVLSLQVGSYIAPSPWTLDGLASHLAQIPIFAGVDTSDLRRVLQKVTLRQLAAGEVLCREGEFHERLYILLHGSLEQSSASASGPGAAMGGQVRILVLGPGSFFGEMAIMADQPEPFTVRAYDGSVVMEVPKAAAHRLMSQSPPFKATMEELYRRRALWTYARLPSSLGGVPELAVRELLSAAERQMIKAGEFITREGFPPQDVFLVRSGFLRVSRQMPGGGERALVYFREGDLFGALPLLMAERSTPYSVQATSRSEVIRIPGRALFEVLTRHPEARGALMTGALEVERVARSSELAPPPQGQRGKRDATHAVAMSVDVLVDEGLAKGHELLVIDQNLCTNCNNCVDACGRRHKYSRLQRRGLQVENLMFPTACRHCEDPVCLLCSVNGIVRLTSGEITIVADNCIGCGACAERCPYGNISMHAVNAPKEGLLFKLVDLLLGGGARERALEELSPKVQRIAVKCDLCAGYGDYACVTACPVGAAFRIDPTKIFGNEDVVIGLEMHKKR